MSSAISFRTRFCAPVGLNGSMLRFVARTWSFSANPMPGSNRALLRFNSNPHSSQKNSSKINRNCAGERKAFSKRKSVPGSGKCSARMEVQRSGSLRLARMLAEDDPRAARRIPECGAKWSATRAW